MNSNRSSNQSQGKANGKNRPQNKKRKAKGPPPDSRPPPQKKQKQASAAAAYATGQSGQGAKLVATAKSCRVTHREFIGNVIGSTAFAIAASFAVNPGLLASFPWLSGIAQNWETYKFRYLRLCYYTRTGTGVPGSVILAHDPDASDAAPSTEAVMTTYESCAEDAPWKDICLVTKAMALHELGPRKFVRTGALAANQDIKLYDAGNLFVGTVDGTAVAWGKLWVEYDIDLFTPQLPPAGVFAGGNINAGGALTAANPLGTLPIVDPQGSGISVDNGSLVTLALAGEYMVVLGLTGTVITAVPAPTPSAGVAATALFTVVLASGLNAMVYYRVVVTVPGATLDFTATATTITSAFLSVGSVPLNSLA